MVSGNLYGPGYDAFRGGFGRTNRPDALARLDAYIENKKNSGGIMKILIIGGYGTIGKTVSGQLSKKHDIIVAGRSSGDVSVDITDSQSIEAMFESIGNVDAVVCIAGEAKWAAFE